MDDGKCDLELEQFLYALSNLGKWPMPDQRKLMLKMFEVCRPLIHQCVTRQGLVDCGLLQALREPGLVDLVMSYIHLPRGTMMCARTFPRFGATEMLTMFAACLLPMMQAGAVAFVHSPRSCGDPVRKFKEHLTSIPDMKRRICSMNNTRVALRPLGAPDWRRPKIEFGNGVGMRGMCPRLIIVDNAGLVTNAVVREAFLPALRRGTPVICVGKSLNATSTWFSSIFDSDDKLVLKFDISVKKSSITKWVSPVKTFT